METAGILLYVRWLRRKPRHYPLVRIRQTDIIISPFAAVGCPLGLRLSIHSLKRSSDPWIGFLNIPVPSADINHTTFLHRRGGGFVSSDGAPNHKISGGKGIPYNVGSESKVRIQLEQLTFDGLIVRWKEVRQPNNPFFLLFEVVRRGPFCAGKP